MGVPRQVVRYGGKRLRRRLGRSIPWIGGLIAVATLGAAIRRKGPFGGTLHTALDAIPYVGALKNAAEAFRGRDFVPDRRTPNVPVGPR